MSGNPYHDAKGEFTSKGGVAHATNTDKVSQATRQAANKVHYTNALGHPISKLQHGHLFNLWMHGAGPKPRTVRSGR